MEFRFGYGVDPYDDSYDDSIGYRLGLLARRPAYQPLFVTPVYMVGINPALARVMQWMGPDVFAAWQEWQEDISGENLSLEQRKSFLKKAIRRNVLILTRDVENSIVERILAMELELGADQYGHVDTTTQSTTTTSSTTTTTLTQEQRNEAGQLYLHSLNTSSSNMNQQQAQTYSQIINGQSEQLAQHFLQTKPNNLSQQNVTQQMSPQQMRTMTTTTTTTTANNNNSNYHMQSQPMAQWYQGAMQAQQQTQNPQFTQELPYQQPLQIAAGPHTPHAPAHFNQHDQQYQQQPQMSPTPQAGGYGPTQGYQQTPLQPALSAPASSNQALSLKEKHEKRRKEKKGK